MTPAWLLWSGLAYLAGAIPFGLLVGYCHGMDVREVGSGNIGTSNVRRALGIRWGIVVLLLDAAKGLVPCWLAWRSTSEPLLLALCMVAAVVGHIYPITLRFKGGKGVATALGVTYVACPVAALSGLFVYFVAIITWRISSVGSLLGVVIALVVSFFLAKDRALLVAQLMITTLVIYHHRDNIARLRKGEEQ